MPSGVYVRTDQCRKNLSESHKGNTAWNKGIKTNVIPWNKGIKITEELREKVREGWKNSQKIKEYWDNYIPVTEEEKKGKIKEYKLLNPDKVKIWKKNDYARNKDTYIKRAKINYSDNRENKKEGARKYYADNKQKVKIKSANWKANNKDKVRVYSENRRCRTNESGKKISNRDVVRQFVIQSDNCFWCNMKLKDYHIDHVIPLSRGGLHTIGNIVISCPKCNVTKNKKLPIEFKIFMNKFKSSDKNEMILNSTPNE